MKRLSWLKQLSVIALSLLFDGCYDRSEEVAVMYEDGSPIRCPDGKETKFVFVTPTNVEGKTLKMLEYEQEIPASSNEHISVWPIRGSIESGIHPWVQFFVYCGESITLVYETPKLYEKDLVKKEGDKGGYIYFVRKGAIRPPGPIRSD